MATASELRQILKEDAAGKNLYDHLTETLMRIVMDRPSNAYDAFELISADIKSNPLNPDPEAGKPVPPSEEEVRTLHDPCRPALGRRIYCILLLGLLFQLPSCGKQTCFLHVSHSFPSCMLTLLPLPLPPQSHTFPSTVYD